MCLIFISVLKIIAKFLSHRQNWAQRLRYVKQWPIVVCKLPISCVQNATFLTILACQIKVKESLEKVNFSKTQYSGVTVNIIFYAVLI